MRTAGWLIRKNARMSRALAWAEPCAARKAEISQMNGKQRAPAAKCSTCPLPTLGPRWSPCRADRAMLFTESRSGQRQREKTMDGDHAGRSVGRTLEPGDGVRAESPRTQRSPAATSSGAVDRRTLILALMSVLGSERLRRVPFEKRTAQLGLTRSGFRFREPEAAAWLGRTYLAIVPSDRDPAALEQMVYGTPLPTSRAAMEKRLTEGIENDFRLGNLVVVAGWCLARTEARLCALSTLG